MSELFTIRSKCLALSLRRAARRIGRLYDDVLRPLDINNGQFSLLAMLAARDDWSMQVLAEAMGLDQSSLSAAIKPLLRRELVLTTVADDDRRLRLLRLTASGRTLVEQAIPLWRTAQAQAERLLDERSPDDVRAALRMLA